MQQLSWPSQPQTVPKVWSALSDVPYASQSHDPLAFREWPTGESSLVARYGGPNSNASGPVPSISGPLGTSLPFAVASPWVNDQGIALIGSAGVPFDDTGLADIEIGRAAASAAGNRTSKSSNWGMPSTTTEYMRYTRLSMRLDPPSSLGGQQHQQQQQRPIRLRAHIAPLPADTWRPAVQRFSDLHGPGVLVPRSTAAGVRAHELAGSGSAYADYRGEPLSGLSAELLGATSGGINWDASFPWQVLGEPMPVAGTDLDTVFTTCTPHSSDVVSPPCSNLTLRQVQGWYDALAQRTSELNATNRASTWRTMTYWNCFEYGQDVYSPGAPVAKWCDRSGLPPGPHSEAQLWIWNQSCARSQVAAGPFLDAVVPCEYERGHWSSPGAGQIDGLGYGLLPCGAYSPSPTPPPLSSVS